MQELVIDFSDCVFWDPVAGDKGRREKNKEKRTSRHCEKALDRPFCPTKVSCWPSRIASLMDEDNENVPR
ncbi:hypothetical protein OUZ56_004610 [Daphnia magna]|uniref:Uncharacterized protein n=1 Tax=Daphnia magna TaxID=35525 RepID=A0ABQ9YQB1_9CRUS|nr:hypothetical protein OUZ56_004610 [Daphnia magna]